MPPSTLSIATSQARAGHPMMCRASAHAAFVAVILSLKSSSNAFMSSSGGPDSMMFRSGRPWLSNWLKLLDYQTTTLVDY